MLGQSWTFHFIWCVSQIIKHVLFSTFSLRSQRSSQLERRDRAQRHRRHHQLGLEVDRAVDRPEGETSEAAGRGPQQLPHLLGPQRLHGKAVEQSAAAAATAAKKGAEKAAKAARTTTTTTREKTTTKADPITAKAATFWNYRRLSFCLFKQLRLLNNKK